MTYAVSGSFVRFLIDEQGIDRFKELVSFSRGPTDDLQDTVEHFRTVYGESLSTVWERWLAWL